MMKISNISFTRNQQGASLIYALMALVVLSLAAVGLVRSVNTGALIAGNLGFKRDTTLSGPAAAEQAIAWLQAKALAGPATLDADDTPNAYFGSARDDMDVTGTATSAARPMQVVNWDGNCLGLAPGSYSSCDVIPFVGTPVNGNRVQWIITRMCDYPLPMGPNPAPIYMNNCSKPKTQWLAIAPEKGELGQGKRLTPVIATPYYRIVTRLEGARNTVSYIETIVHF
jgi:type IV pilus assembly protein PilX